MLTLDKPTPTFVDRLRAITASATRHEDPWLNKLAGLKGQKGSDGVSRLSTAAVFDALELRAIERTPAAGKRVKALMESLGWTSLRQISLSPSGTAARMRGFARQA